MPSDVAPCEALLFFFFCGQLQSLLVGGINLDGCLVTCVGGRSCRGLVEPHIDHVCGQERAGMLCCRAS